MPRSGRGFGFVQLVAARWTARSLPVLAIVGLYVCPLRAFAEDLAKPAPVPAGWDMAAVPAVNFTSDDGFGAGATGTAYFRNGGERPFAHAVTLRLFATTRGLQSHILRWDAPDFAGLAVRLTSEVGLFSLASANYCGVGNGVTCATEAADAAAQTQGLSGDAATTAAAHFYKLRYTRPYAMTLARLTISRSAQQRIEIFGGWRGAYYFPGTPSDPGPYTGSLYANTFGAGERGLVSLVQLGVARDSRDVESAPTTGARAEASVRAAPSLLGSDYAFWGANVSAASWLSPWPNRALVLALRGVVDFVQGDVPTGELSRVGGTLLYAAYGGESAGRGIRQSRYLGEFKAFTQAELRATWWRGQVFARTLDLGTVAFADVGVVTSARADAMAGGGAHLGLGAGGRATVNRDFIVRADLAVSPDEQWAPRLYLNLGHVF